MELMEDHDKGNRLWSLVCHGGLCLLGVVFIFAAVTKAVYFQSFIDSLAAYGIHAHGLQVPLGNGLILFELLLGVSVVAGWQVRRALQSMCALLVFFILETVVHWSALQSVQCGCFGPLSATGPGMSMVHEGLILLVAFLLLKLLFRVGMPTAWHAGRMWATLGLVAAALVYSVVVHPPQASGVIHRGPGLEVRVVLSATCAHCRQLAGNVQSLQQQMHSPEVTIYLGAQTSDEIDDFVKTTGVQLVYVPVTFRQLQQMSSSVPAVQIVRNGAILKNWIGEVPSLGELQSALGAAGGTPALSAQSQ